MGDEFYAIIKLVSGEEILSLVSVDENDGDPLIVMQSPITMKMIHTNRGLHVKVKSWMELASDDFFIVKPDRLITITETSDEKLIDIYNNFLNDEEEDSIKIHKSNKVGNTNKVKPSKKMGYVSSVESARKHLENLYKLKDNKES